MAQNSYDLHVKTQVVRGSVIFDSLCMENRIHPNKLHLIDKKSILMMSIRTITQTTWLRGPIPNSSSMSSSPSSKSLRNRVCSYCLLLFFQYWYPAIRPTINTVDTATLITRTTAQCNPFELVSDLGEWVEAVKKTDYKWVIHVYFCICKIGSIWHVCTPKDLK